MWVRHMGRASSWLFALSQLPAATGNAKFSTEGKDLDFFS